MTRDIVHAKFPFTEDEIAAAWIVEGCSVAEARLMAQDLRRELSSPPPAEHDPEGWFAYGPSIGFVGGFDVVLKLVADLHAEHTLLSDEARDALLDVWPRPFPMAEATLVLDRLEQLGASWARLRAPLHRLLAGQRP